MSNGVKYIDIIEKTKENRMVILLKKPNTVPIELILNKKKINN